MANKIKLSVHDKHTEEIKKFKWFAYIKTKESVRTIGVYSSTENMIGANTNKSLKALKNKFNYTIQLVIE